MQPVIDFIGTINDVIWADAVLYAVLGVGVLFTVWSGFCQYRALTHGTQVVRGKYDDPDDPGAINHFQALSAALSATVGLGNIGGVALAISLGGPGAVFWMWVVGAVGMSLKLTEVTLAMLYRNTDDPNNPHGGAMWVAQKGFKRWGAGGLGTAVGAVFCVTLLISAITGGNMFQAWNVADVTREYFDVPQQATGIVLAIIVGMVIIGGIKRIGAVAGRLVPFMCVLYLLSALYVLVMRIDLVPQMLALIVTSAFNPLEAEGAFIGGAWGYAFLWGMKRALFSNEAGQGSAPIAHSAAKTDEPVREAVVAGLEPFIDTIVVCTLTALVILCSGLWNRAPEVVLDEMPEVAPAVDETGAAKERAWALSSTVLPDYGGLEEGDWTEAVSIIVAADDNEESNNVLHKIGGDVTVSEDGTVTIAWKEVESRAAPHFDFGELASATPPGGVYLSFTGATLTAKAFDDVTPGLGKWLVTLAAWLFAISTMISWSYYGEQGVIYLFGERVVLPYKLVYCLFIIVAAVPQLVTTDDELDTLTSLGTGVMLWANIPIMMIFGYQAMGAYHSYMKRLKSGELDQHDAPSITDVVEGRDVE